jgi:tellurite resistance protein TerC
MLSALIIEFQWIIYIFGGFLVYTGAHMLWNFIRNKKEKVDVEKHIVVRVASRYFNVYPRFAGHRFWLRENGKLFITPLFLVLLVIEFSDVIFAVDSVPAIFSVTLDPYIVFFSNIFAIIGLRSLFFLVSSIMEKFWLLKAGLAILLAFVGLKMLVHSWVPLDTVTSLVIILSILVLSITLSFLIPRQRSK